MATVQANGASKKMRTDLGIFEPGHVRRFVAWLDCIGRPLGRLRSSGQQGANCQAHDYRGGQILNFTKISAGHNVTLWSQPSLFGQFVRVIKSDPIEQPTNRRTERTDTGPMRLPPHLPQAPGLLTTKNLTCGARDVMIC